MTCPKGPCTQIAYTLAPKYPYRDYFKAKVKTIWVPGTLRPLFPKPYRTLIEPFKGTLTGTCTLRDVAGVFCEEFRGFGFRVKCSGVLGLHGCLQGFRV